MAHRRRRTAVKPAMESRKPDRTSSPQKATILNSRSTGKPWLRANTSAKSNGSIVQETLRAVVSRNPALREALKFLFSGAAETLSFQRLRLQPLVAAHRNPFSAEPFLLPKERFGGSQDVALVPLVRNVVDETLRAYASESPYLLEYVGKTPISPYGSLGLSVSRWGHVDWDYIRDLDWRIFLPPRDRPCFRLQVIPGADPDIGAPEIRTLSAFGWEGCAGAAPRYNYATSGPRRSTGFTSFSSP